MPNYLPLILLALVPFSFIAASRIVSRPENATAWWSRLFAWPEGVAALAVCATLVFIGWQALLTRQALDLAQSANRSELRAYISVTLEKGNYQNREKNQAFLGMPTITNSGRTPARNVRFRVNSAVLNEPLQSDYVFAPGSEPHGGLTVGVNAQIFQIITLDHYVDKQDVAGIMSGDGKAFYCWGEVFYEDVFGDEHETDFGFRLSFPENTDKPGSFSVIGTYLSGHSKAT